jgi:hypothetical protein
MKDDKELEKLVMGKIKSGQVKLKSKYLFVAEKLGLGTAFGLTVVLSALFFNLILFYMKETDNLKYLSFGRDGIFAFLETFPYLIVVLFIILMVLASYLITKSESLYKRSYSHLVIFLILSIMFIGGMLTYTNVANEIERESLKEGPGRFFRPLIGPPDIRERGVSGLVYEKGEGYIIVKTPRGLINVSLSSDNRVESALEEGKFIIAIGEKEGGVFIARKINVVEKGDIPSIERGITVRFKPFEGGEECKGLPPMHFDESEKQCIKDCLKGGICFRECIPRCIKSRQ